MRASSYRIEITKESVDVECHAGLVSSRFPSSASPTTVGCLFVVASLVLILRDCFDSGENPGVFKMISNSRPGSATFLGAILLLVLYVLLLAVGIRYFLPFRERLHCDRSALTWSRIAWLSFGNRWITRSVPFSEITGASYAIVYQGYFGIVLETYDESWKMFWGIKSPEANRILRGLEKLGVNVHKDREMRELIREELRDRRAEL